MRLSQAALRRLAPGIARFAYDRSAQATGIVHFGLGAFHRAHQAWYTDLAMDSGDRDWAIAGVSLRSPAVAGQLGPQDGLYSLTERGEGAITTRVIGAVREALVGGRDSARIVERIAASECHVVSFTVTEKGYAQGAEGALDLPLAEASFYPLLAEGLARRRSCGLPGLTLLTCDNLADNGRRLEALLGEHLALQSSELREWFAAQCACPNSMVDRIVPATTDVDLAAAETALGLRDEGAVFAERFSQWVVEDRFAGPRPGWEKVGAQLVRDVAPYETAKLRMLNGAHSALAYLGLERGHEFVHQAIADPSLRVLVERLMRQEAAVSFVAAPGQDLEAYADALLARFADPALNHRLVQIAIDGSQKIPQRWLPVLAFHQRHGSDCPAVLTALAAWLRHLRGDNGPVDDPLAERLAALWRSAGEGGIAAALFGEGGLLAAHWRANETSLRRLTSEIARRPD